MASLPFTTSGTLQIAASQELGMLGATRGPALDYVWTPPSRMPLVLPWLCVLLLMMIQPNRTRQAWAIWLPLACIVGLEIGARAWLGFIPSASRDMLCDATEALAFGMAALWLLATGLNHRSRIAAAIRICLLLSIVSSTVFAVRQDWQASSGSGLQLALFVSLAAFLVALALTLAGWSSRKLYSAGRFAFLFVGFQTGLWAALMAGLFGYGSLSSGGQVPWAQVLAATAVPWSVCLTAALPFLFLAGLNSFFSERLRELLHLPQPAPELANVCTIGPADAGARLTGGGKLD